MKISDFSSFIYCSWSKVMWLDKLLENMLQKLHWFKVRKHWTKKKYPSNKLPLSLLPLYFISVHLTPVDRLIDETSSVCSFKLLCHAILFHLCFQVFLPRPIFCPVSLPLHTCSSCSSDCFPYLPVLVFGSVIGDAFWFLYFLLFSLSLVFAIVLYFVSLS